MNKKSLKGLTIIEILIALTITAVILGIIYSSYFSTIRTRDASMARIKDYRVASAVLDKIGRDLSCTYFSERDKQTKFDGHTDSLTFITTHCLGISEEQDLCSVEYLLKDASPQDKYCSIWRKQDGNAFSFGNYFQELNFRYYDGKEWLKEWDSDWMGRLPLAVKIEILLRIDEAEPKDFVTIYSIPLAQI